MVVRTLLTLYFALATLAGPLVCCCYGGGPLASREAVESAPVDAESCPCCRGGSDQSKPAPIPEPCRCTCPLKDRPTAVVEKAPDLSFPAVAFAEYASLDLAPAFQPLHVTDATVDADRDPPTAPARLAVLCQFRC
jgi:hypothetical protein